MLQGSLRENPDILKSFLWKGLVCCWLPFVYTAKITNLIDAWAKKTAPIHHSCSMHHIGELWPSFIQWIHAIGHANLEWHANLPRAKLLEHTPAPSISKKVVRWYRVKTPVLFSQLCFACLWKIETALPQSYCGYFLVSHFRLISGEWNSWIHRGSSVDLIYSWTVHRIIHPLSTPPNSSNAWPTHLQAHATHLSHCRAYTIMFGAQNQGPTWRKTRHLATWRKKKGPQAGKQRNNYTGIPYPLPAVTLEWPMIFLFPTGKDMLYTFLGGHDTLDGSEIRWEGR